jgi:hypothetical protein
MKTKTTVKKKRCCRGWEIDTLQERLDECLKQLKYLQSTVVQTRIKIYSSTQHICIGMNHPLWHRIVCKYEGDRCLGGVEPHWTSTWSIDDRGYHIESLIDENWKGWEGQYNPTNTLKWHELPRDILNKHFNKLQEHTKTLGYYYPCAIYNDFTGELSTP